MIWTKLGSLFKVIHFTKKNKKTFKQGCLYRKKLGTADLEQWLNSATNVLIDPYHKLMNSIFCNITDQSAICMMHSHHGHQNSRNTPKLLLSLLKICLLI